MTIRRESILAISTMGKMLASRRTSVSEYKAAFDLIDRDAVEKESTLSISVYCRGDSMIFKISWATDPCRSGTV